ncbi:general substrate transporter [Lipomyces doorenjongii]|uniref:general substrate transporter n=1 Tax=Lipomyces doorenjongii TaxID=383834 RepID=UPI0034CFD9F4
MAQPLNVYTISAFLSLGVALIGFDISSVSGVLGTHQDMEFYGNPQGALQGVITGAMAAGSFVRALFAADISRFSRKLTIHAGLVLWCIGSAVQSASTGVGMLIAGRVVFGLCIGLTASLVPTYHAEIAPHKIRGRIVSFQSLAGAMGIMVQYFIQYVPWTVQSVPAVILLIGLFWFPRSPRWLASKARWDEVLNVLARLRTANNDISDPFALAEYKEIEDRVRLDELEEQSKSIFDLLSPKVRKRVFLGMAIQIWSQLTGINIMMYYVVYILEAAGVSDVLLKASFQYTINVVMTIPAILPCLLLGALAMACCLFVIGGLLRGYGQPNPVPFQPTNRVVMDHPAVRRTILAASCIAGRISWIYQAEVVPLRVRARSVAISTSCCPVLLRSIGGAIFFLFALFDVVAFIHVLFAAPETKQRTLEEMDEIFEHGPLLYGSFAASRATNKLDRLARDIELGILIIHRHSLENSQRLS